MRNRAARLLDGFAACGYQAGSAVRRASRSNDSPSAQGCRVMRIARMQASVVAALVISGVVGGCGLSPKRRVPPDPAFAQGGAGSPLQFGSAAQPSPFEGLNAAQPPSNSGAPLVYPDPALQRAATEGGSQLTAPPILGGAPIGPDAVAR